MPSSSSFQHQTQVIREIVPTNSDRLENRFFFLALLTVVILAAGLLWFSHQEKGTAKQLPYQLSNLATQLSIASDEIALLQDAQVLSQQLTLSELQQNELEPFITEEVIGVSFTCFLVIKTKATLRLVKSSGSRWQVEWREDAGRHKEPGESIALHHNELCEPNKLWLTVASEAN